MTKELDENWSNVYKEVYKEDLPEGANMMSSHAIYKINKDDEGTMNLQGCIFVDVNRHSDRYQVRAEYVATDMAVIRMLSSIGTGLGFTFSFAYINCAFMKSGLVTR